MASDEDKLDQTFAALANTTRRAILARLAEGEATVNELAEPFDMSLPAISKHIIIYPIGCCKPGTLNIQRDSTPMLQNPQGFRASRYKTSGWVSF